MSTQHHDSPYAGNVPTLPAPGTPQRPQPIGVPTVATPEKVTELHAIYRKVEGAFQEAYDRRAIARQAVKRAWAEDIVADAEAFAAGEKPMPEAKRSEPAALKELEEADRQLIVLTRSGTLSRVNLEREIVAARDPWLADVTVEETAAVTAYRDTLAAFAAAAERLARTRGARLWLERVDRDVPSGSPVGRFDVTVRNTPHPYTELIAALGGVAEAPAEPRRPEATESESELSHA